MELPIDILNIITDYYVSMLMFESKQRIHTEFLKNNMICHLKTFHETTHVGNQFCHKFCLAVLKYMRKHSMFI